MRVLTLDIGNSRASFGVFEQDALVERWDVPNTSFVPGMVQTQHVDRIAISCVSKAHRECVAQLQAQCGIPVLMLDASVSPVVLHYDCPNRLGSDRIANVLAAHEKSLAGAVVIDLGTATHFDICEADGSFRGGPILPGLETMMTMLTARIPHLPQVDISSHCSPVVTRTEDGIRAGCLYATAGAVERVCREITAQIGSMPIYLTGGNAPVIAPLVLHDAVDLNLTLRGLYLFACSS